MEPNPAKALDGAALSLKRKRATQCVAHLTGASAPSNLIIKQMRLVGDEGKPADSGPGISRSLVRYYLNYKKSGMPKRLMFYKNGEWFDYPKDAVDLVKKNFEIKKAAVEVELGGHNVVLDFLHMYSVDLKTGLQQPIAWTDELGCCFFPEVFAAIEQEQDVDLDAYTESAYGKLDIDSVQKMFLTGMTTLGVTNADIVEIYRSSAQLFCIWHFYGFPVQYCAPYCDVDESGIKHLVLCRVIMGNMEILRPGSGQLRPSGCEYDNGVDDIQHPKYYVVWNMNINTHIYPEFVVSFKAALDAEGNVCSNESKKNGSGDSTVDTGKAASVPANTRRTPKSPWLPFPVLFAAIRNRVPPNVMFLIRPHYAQLMSKKISRADFVMKLRDQMVNQTNQTLSKSEAF
ncbi:hypothetical protein TSUD_237260 [Trifolium subterraneum]|uniref:PARP catalytic domain-containing protein n=1 Tax=Trifolium subterraneum TaxID=3900 RepID=A0A2Z6NCR1_TRISU|nr:hypothetical protein TSUD_237260 [Trifolium subterraneum]